MPDDTLPQGLRRVPHKSDDPIPDLVRIVDLVVEVHGAEELLKYLQKATISKLYTACHRYLRINKITNAPKS